jgi:hypothetical protein
MYKLVSEIEGSKWSYCDGYQIYSNIVWVGDKDDAKKYKLIDSNGKEIKINLEDYLFECQ